MVRILALIYVFTLILNMNCQSDIVIDSEGNIHVIGDNASLLSEQYGKKLSDFQIVTDGHGYVDLYMDNKYIPRSRRATNYFESNDRQITDNLWIKMNTVELLEDPLDPTNGYLALGIRNDNVLKVTFLVQYGKKENHSIFKTYNNYFSYQLDHYKGQQINALYCEGETLVSKIIKDADINLISYGLIRGVEVKLSSKVKNDDGSTDNFTTIIWMVLEDFPINVLFMFLIVIFECGFLYDSLKYSVKIEEVYRDSDSNGDNHDILKLKVLKCIILSIAANNNLWMFLYLFINYLNSDQYFFPIVVYGPVLIASLLQFSLEASNIGVIGNVSSRDIAEIIIGIIITLYFLLLYFVLWNIVIDFYIFSTFIYLVFHSVFLISIILNVGLKIRMGFSTLGLVGYFMIYILFPISPFAPTQFVEDYGPLLSLKMLLIAIISIGMLKIQEKYGSWAGFPSQFRKKLYDQYTCKIDDIEDNSKLGDLGLNPLNEPELQYSQRNKSKFQKFNIGTYYKIGGGHMYHPTCLLSQVTDTSKECPKCKKYVDTDRYLD